MKLIRYMSHSTTYKHWFNSETKQLAMLSVHLFTCKDQTVGLNKPSSLLIKAKNEIADRAGDIKSFKVPVEELNGTKKEAFPFRETTNGTKDVRKAKITTAEEITRLTK
ncbi:hypothetical protein CHS0354_003251, partial [Potamilus streckersoni]